MRNLWLAIFVGLVLAVGLPVPAKGQSKPNSSLGIQLPVLRMPSTENDVIQKRVAEWFRLWRQGQTKAALQACREVHQLQTELGISNVFLFSSALVLLGDQLRQKGKTAEAHALYTWANTISPLMSRPYFRLTWTTLTTQPTRLHIAARLLVKGLQTMVESPLEVAVITAGVLRFLSWTLGMAFLLLWICLLIRCIRPFLMDLRELFPPGVTSFQMSLMSLLLLLLPPLMGAGMLDTLLFWVLFSWFYQNLRERILTTMGLLLVSILPFVAMIMGKFVSLVDSPTQALYFLNQSELRTKSSQQLELFLQKNPNDVDALWSLGLYYKRIGQLQTARLYYEKALKVSASHPALQVNLGNLFFIEREPERSFAFYQKALRTQTLPEGQFNISQILKHSSSTAGEVVQQKVDALQAALRTGGSRVEHFEQQVQTQLNRYIMDVALPFWRYWERLWELSDRTQVFSRVWCSLSSWIPVKYAPWTGLTMVMFLWLIFPAGRRWFCGQSCTQCGILYRPSPSDQHVSSVCSQCEHLVQKKDGLSPARRVQKEIEIQRYQRLRYYSQAVSATLLVGSGHILRRKTWKGFFLFLCFATTLYLWLFPQPLFMHPFWLGDTSSLWLPLGMTVWTGWLYFLSLREILSDG